MFVYDSIRVIVIVLSLLAAAGSGTADGTGTPLLMYAAPNALFPLLALFLLMSPGAEGRPCLLLYFAGKIAAALAGAAWFLFSQKGVLESAFFHLAARNWAALAAPVSTVFLLFFDGISILCAAALMRGGGPDAAKKEGGFFGPDARESLPEGGK
ncbi:MAG: hypothetical protein LBC88_00930 [Spirochaetaceae bacterium]|nr:hypothetical protein [Spirochaetaceae bacterium]